MARLLIDPATLDARGREITDSAETFIGNNKKINADTIRRYLSL